MADTEGPTDAEAAAHALDILQAAFGVSPETPLEECPPRLLALAAMAAAMDEQGQLDLWKSRRGML